MSRFCIIGCGLTGAVTASLLKQILPHVQVTILEKSKGTGGRFGTSRSSFGSTVDLGAQYVTMTESLTDIQKRCYAELLENGVLKPLEAEVEGLKTNKEVKNFYCPLGSGSVVKHFVTSSGCEVLFGQKVTKLHANGDKWKLLCDNNSSHEFDTVILAVPVPQILQIEGILLYLKGKELENMKTVEYSSRFTLGLFYDHPTDYFDHISYVSKYISNDNILRFCSFDHRKRNSSDLPSVVVHTTKEFGKKYIEEESAIVGKQILNSVMKMLPNFPEPSFVKYHKWRYSQVEKCYPGKPGCLVLTSKPLLMSGGDGFSYSTFEGCVYSSEKILQCITENR